MEQAPHRAVSFDSFWPGTTGPALHWPASRLPPPLPGQSAMEIEGLLNTRHGGPGNVSMGQHLQHPMSVDAGGYAMAQPSNQSMNHHQPQMHDSTMNYPHVQHTSASQMYANNYDARSQNGASTMDEDYSDNRQRSEGPAKAFACSTCNKGFARRSDLARHGRPDDCCFLCQY
jgi:hypothetical protein